MRRMIFKAGGKDGFLRSSLAPIDRSKEPTFGFWDAVEIAALIVGVLVAMRIFVR